MKIIRTRRNRKAEWIRNLLCDNSLSVNDLIYPIFCLDCNSGKDAIEQMPNFYRLGSNDVIDEVRRARDIGINAVMLFPIIPSDKKTDCGSYAYSSDNKFLRLISKIKKQVPDVGVICDVALDPYTLHGHDGVLDEENYVDNDKTVGSLVKQALCLAGAGADAIAPSDMMDGRVLKIRDALEVQGYKNLNIISYSAKFASNFYGPFRKAVGSADKMGRLDKKSYQLNPANNIEALRKIESDINEGADSVIVKPASHYLDIVSHIRKEYNVPVFAYQVSGEYSMMKLAAGNGILDYKDAILESLLCFKRAGANAIVTYAAFEVAEFLNG